MSWVNLNDLYATKTELATKVPTSRTINGKALSSNVTLGASDIKLSDNTTLQSAWDSISQRLEIGDNIKSAKVTGGTSTTGRLFAIGVTRSDGRVYNFMIDSYGYGVYDSSDGKTLWYRNIS